MNAARSTEPTVPMTAPDDVANPRRRVPGLGWVVAGLVLAGVIFLTVGPDLIPGLGSGLLDRVVHAAAYSAAMAAILLARIRPMGGHTRRAWIEPLWWALALAILGGVMEVAQGLEGRDADAVDGLANASGVAVVLLLWWLLLGIRWMVRSIRRPPSERRSDPVA